jgi:hypothetical protein
MRNIFESIGSGISGAFDSVRDFVVGAGADDAAAAKKPEPMGEGAKFAANAGAVATGVLAATVVEKTVEYAAGATAKGLKPRGGMLLFGR